MRNPFADSYHWSKRIWAPNPFVVLLRKAQTDLAIRIWTTLVPIRLKKPEKNGFGPFLYKFFVCIRVGLTFRRFSRRKSNPKRHVKIQDREILIINLASELQDYSLLYSCTGMYVGICTYISTVNGCTLCSWSTEQGFPSPRLPRRIWPCKTGLANKSRISPLILRIQVESSAHLRALLLFPLFATA